MTNENYRSGALWKSRCQIAAIDGDTGTWKFLPPFSIVMILKIKEEFDQTYLKILYQGKIYYIDDVDPALMFSMNWNPK